LNLQARCDEIPISPNQLSQLFFQLLPLSFYALFVSKKMGVIALSNVTVRGNSLKNLCSKLFEGVIA